jgi:hypothetical protein
VAWCYQYFHFALSGYEVVSALTASDAQFATGLDRRRNQCFLVWWCTQHPFDGQIYSIVWYCHAVMICGWKACPYTRRFSKGRGTHKPSLTALTTGLSMLPLALADGSGAKLQKPLAIVISSGMVTTSMLTLLVLPMLYYMVGNNGNSKN